MGIKTQHVVASDCVTHHGWMVRCPACGFPHCFDTRWAFNGDHEKPTFSPSMLVETPNDKDPAQRRCHSFLTDGVWRYCTDSTHSLAGQSVAVPDWAAP